MIILMITMLTRIVIIRTSIMIIMCYISIYIYVYIYIYIYTCMYVCMYMYHK